MNDAVPPPDSVDPGSAVTEGAADPEQEPGADLEQVGYTTEIVEVFPNVVVVLGALPAELEHVLEPLNTGLLSVFDRDHVNNALSLVGNGATVGGNLAQAAMSMQGLYKMADESQALLQAGRKLAAKDGKNLGTILMPGTTGGDVI